MYYIFLLHTERIFFQLFFRISMAAIVDLSAAMTGLLCIKVCMYRPFAYAHLLESFGEDSLPLPRGLLLVQYVRVILCLSIHVPKSIQFTVG
jgi:hypothetical protein